MVYRAVLSETAEGDAGQIYDWIIEHAPSRGLEWFGELVDSLYSLEQLPYRCPLAREAAQARRRFDVYCLEVGNMPIAFCTKLTKPARPYGSCRSGVARFVQPF